ncbi:MAG: hypothetical protein E7001_02900 [Coriobacteriaceae bacterium]|nr:hypothetical protein [Coriobacteriaceae bacterium]
MTSYAFTPIPDELADVLQEAVQGSINGDCLVRVTSKGRRYRRELARWQESRRIEAEAEASRERRSASREWAIAAIGAAATILSGLIGYVIGTMR